MNKNILIQMIKSSGAIQAGDFTLASGMKSTLYVDMKKVTLGPGLHYVCRYICRELRAWSLPFDAIGGPGFGAAPLIGALLSSGSCRDNRGYYPNGFVVRPATKDHGMDGHVMGTVQPGDRCVMIEDVATTGKSLLDAIDAVEREVDGARVVHALAILDRGMEVEAKLRERGIGWTALLTIDDLGIQGQ